ncbi:MAG: prepilin peptidase [Hyphomicrobium sp.]|nr:prepilin peptidase [Hyphomicrobium sp.]
MNVVQQALLLVFPVVMAFAAANDLFTMRIPNKLSLILIASFAAVAIVAGLTLETIAMHLAVGAAILAITFILFSFRLLGGGDAKLMAAGALWIGFDQMVPYLFYMTLFGGVLSLVILAYRRMVPLTPVGFPDWAQRLHAQGTGIPYGIAIAAAGLMIYPQTPIFKALLA